MHNLQWTFTLAERLSPIATNSLSGLYISMDSGNGASSLPVKRLTVTKLFDSKHELPSGSIRPSAANVRFDDKIKPAKHISNEPDLQIPTISPLPALFWTILDTVTKQIGTKGTRDKRDRPFCICSYCICYPYTHVMPGLRRRGGNGERRSGAHGAARSHVAYYTKIKCATRSRSSRSAPGLKPPRAEEPTSSP